MLPFGALRLLAVVPALAAALYGVSPLVPAPFHEAGDGPPVSAACAAGATKIGSDPAVQAAFDKFNADQQVINTAAFAKCGTEIVANKTCHAAFDWSPVQQDVDAFSSAVKKVESTANVCFLDLNTTDNNMGYSFKVFEKRFTAQWISHACTAADSQIFLTWVENSTAKSNPNLTDISIAFSDPACPPVSL